MEFKQLQSFVAVVDYKSFTKAAEKLYISQPTISIHIHALEEELSTQLIVRTTKSIEVTPRGYELYEFAKHVLDLRDHLLQRWTEESQKVIRLGASTIPSAYILPELLSDFRKEHEEIQFAIQQSDSWGVVDGVLNSTFDIGLIGMHWEDKMLSCVPFCQDHMVLITPVNEHFLALKKHHSLTIEELRRERFILREKGSGSQKNVDRFLEKIGITGEDLQVAARVNDQESIKNLVANGLGVSVVSERAASNFIQEGRLLQFELPGCEAERNLYLVFRKDHILKGNIRKFIDYLQAYYKK